MAWQVIIVTSENGPGLGLLGWNTQIQASMPLSVCLSAFLSHLPPKGLVTGCLLLSFLSTCTSASVAKAQTDAHADDAHKKAK